MKDAQEKVDFKPYSENIGNEAQAVQDAVVNRNVVDMAAMVTAMQSEAQSSQLALATQPSAASSSDQPLVPSQGSVDVAQGMFMGGGGAITFYSGQTIPEAGLFTMMPLADQQALHMTAIDLISRRFRERMAGCCVRESPQIPDLDDAAADFVQAALDIDPE